MKFNGLKSLWYNYDMSAVGIKEIEEIKKRVRLCDYLVVAQLFLQDNFLLERELTFDDIKARLLGHWGRAMGLTWHMRI